MKVQGREMNIPRISLHSFVLGFILGCAVIYVLYQCMCGVTDSCAIIRDEVYVQVEPLPQQVFVVQEDTDREESEHSKNRESNMKSPQQVSHTSFQEDDVNAKLIESDHPSKIENFCPHGPIHLVILVLTAPAGYMRRNAIRGTWLHDYHRGDIKVTARFLIGTYNLDKHRIANLTRENNQFGDLLLLENLKDSYSNLSTKVLLGLEWANTLEHFDFLLKTDDDSYVRIGPIVANLRQMNCDPTLYWGYFMGHAFPEPSGKWAENCWFHCPHYLPYAMGGGYIISQRIINLIMRFSNRLKVYNNEDVTIGSWLAPFNLNRKHDLRFNVESLSHGCNNNYLVAHKERVRSMYEKYTALVKNGTLCAEEREIRPGYDYKWSVSPLDCCDRTKGLVVPNVM